MRFNLHLIFVTFAQTGRLRKIAIFVIFVISVRSAIFVRPVKLAKFKIVFLKFLVTAARNCKNLQFLENLKLHAFLDTSGENMT